MSGSLYIVSTPIGNLDDISQRAAGVLSSVAVVAAEDTRRTGMLLSSLGIQARLVSCHDHNELQRAEQLLEKLRAGDDVALVCDAGTPLISDPGFRLVRVVQAEGFAVIPVPGASALLAALVVAGLPTDRFAFEGFAPGKGSARKSFLQRVAESPVTTVVYEAPHRILSFLEDFHSLVGKERELVLCRELTKRYETVIRGPLQQVLERVRQDENQQRGEIVLVISAATTSVISDQALKKLAGLLSDELPPSRAAKVLAAWSGQPRQAIYQLLENRGKPERF